MMEPTLSPDPLIGRTLRAYQILEQIGVSRWGKVYRAFHGSTNRTVALRILSAELAATPGKTEHFLEESRADASLAHPHLVAVYEAGQADGIYFCAMEYMDGPPLPEFLQKAGGVDEHRLLLTIVGMARALEFLWQRQVPHQPPLDKNVLANADGAVKLINVEPVEVQPSRSPHEDVVNLGVLVATLANDIAPADMLHLLYGVLVAFGWPGVYIYTHAHSTRREAALYALMSFFMFGLALRAVITGGGLTR